MDELRPKCTRKAWCTRLEVSLNPGNARGKGLSSVEVTDFKKSTATVIGVCYKTSVNDAGVMINFCPWCGSKILITNRPKETPKP